MDKILSREYPDIYKTLNRKNVNLQICMVEWIFSLFSSLIPLEIQLNFYEGFFAEGWSFFYKMSIAIMLSIDLSSPSYQDPEDIYIALKLGKNFDSNKEKLIEKWENIIKKAYKIEIKTST